jgi:diguanylate cyclase (GGDEF)-like protein/PAS domain S-box-containing protein
MAKQEAANGDNEPGGLGRAFDDMAARLSICERELREAARALEDERSASDEAQRIARVGSWSWDAEGEVATWSAQLYRIFDRDTEQGPAMGAELYAYFHPDDRDVVAAAFAQVFGAGAQSFELECRIDSGNGVKRTLHARGRRDPDRPSRVVGTVQDATELRHVELGVRRERDYTAAITRSMREGFLVTRNGAILEVNQALCELTGFQREELIGLTVPYPFWEPEATEQIMRHRGLIDAEQSHEFETTYVRKDGRQFDASISSVVARTREGELLGYVSTVRDVSERNRHVAELERLATHDPLTGLANHRVLHEQLRTEVARASRHGHPLSVAVLDLDHFKQVNDRYGHPVGDNVLCEVAQRLCGVAREGELLARVGGEEFAWILNAEGDDAFAAAERARHAIGATSFPEVGTVTISIGVCDLTAAGESVQLYQRADQALYLAKRQGRNRSFLYPAAGRLTSIPRGNRG